MNRAFAVPIAGMAAAVARVRSGGADHHAGEVRLRGPRQPQ